MQVDQIKQFVAHAIGTKKYTKFSRWQLEEDEIEQGIVRNQKAQIYESLSKKMDFFSEAKNTNQKQMHLEKNAVFFKSCIAAKVAPAPLLSQIVNG